jgi:5-methylcytosine-specific restriction endonuclease McrA
VSWFRVDDQFFDNPKARAAGLFGRALWWAAGVAIAKSASDGIVLPGMLAIHAAYAEVPPNKTKAAVAALVESTLWHTADQVPDCASCSATYPDGIPRGAWLFHDWADYQPKTRLKDNPLEKLIEKRKRELHRNDPLKEAIVARDGGRCRYCAQTVTFGGGDRKSRHRATFDHVNPGKFAPYGGNHIDDVALACGHCNGRKGQRTPAEANMPLLPAPGTPAPRSAPVPAPHPASADTEAENGAENPVSAPPASTDGPGADPRQICDGSATDQRQIKTGLASREGGRDSGRDGSDRIGPGSGADRVADRGGSRRGPSAAGPGPPASAGAAERLVRDAFPGTEELPP